MTKRFILLKDIFGESWKRGGVVDLAEVTMIAPANIAVPRTLNDIRIITRGGAETRIIVEDLNQSSIVAANDKLVQAFMDYVTAQAEGPELPPEQIKPTREEKLARFNEMVIAEISKLTDYGRLSAFHLSITETTEWNQKDLNDLDSFLKYRPGAWTNQYRKIMECEDDLW
ncbi:hypothetical protein CPT_Moabite_089 [Serratia phage Moabite]|uniref:Uncharacterized protein n=1 Tax=Serratia phage Moabite TaxID=2587814 RepID=A0A4Y5TQ81_9CAUD|nr:hypothetical protein HWC48_gp327 [Serratia phage Moabite]QDB71119.1 hypothetical protein CPT_Moabite_089 [Serratia phage Moabite]UGO54300.1 hypothetical protein HAYMO_320 [Serratia phage vB_SmaM_Haymo]